MTVQKHNVTYRPVVIVQESHTFCPDSAHKQWTSNSFALIFDLEIFLTFNSLCTSVNVKYFGLNLFSDIQVVPVELNQKKPNKLLD